MESTEVVERQVVFVLVWETHDGPIFLSVWTTEAAAEAERLKRPGRFGEAAAVLRVALDDPRPEID